jgi:predicted DNA-binding WGR domain protein
LDHRRPAKDDASADYAASGRAGKDCNRTERGEWRFYRIEVWPDLFGRAILARRWGRIGTAGSLRLEPYPDPGAAINALAHVCDAKRRRGYRDQAA